MLDQDTLSQLKGLKAQIRSSRDIRTGIFRPTQSRFGFVRDSEGNDVFLAPDQASKLLPGDSVEIEVVTDDKNRAQGTILKLLQSDFKRCHGICIERGKGFFVETDDANRVWMFVPPKNRKGAKAGDRVVASLIKHPYKNEGKGQLRIDEVIGDNNSVGIETAYAVSKFGIPTTWPHDEGAELTQLEQQLEDVIAARPVSPLPFVSIDSAATRDVDDAIYCEANDNGWLVAVAIADPCSVINKGSALEQAAKARGATCYFPHGPLPMLPEELSSGNLSLLAHKKRPAVVCTLQITSNGEVASADFALASIVSAAKLNYFQVSQYLDHGTIADEFTTDIQHILATAKLATDALRAKRDADALMNDSDRIDYRFRLNERGKIEDIVAIERSSAHTLIEEIMLATNRACAEFLVNNKVGGPFSVHQGIRPERLAESKKLLEELAPNLANDTDLSTMTGFAAAKIAAATDSGKHLVRPLRRLLSRAAIQTTAAPHFGLGFAQYTTMTSPLRRYQDLLVHFQLHAILQQQAPLQLNDDELSALSQRLLDNREAVRQCESDLIAQYAQRLSDKTFEAEVIQLNGKQLTLRILTNGIHGSLATSALGKKWKYDALRGKLSNDSATILLGDRFQVSISATNEVQRSISFSLAEADKTNADAAN